MAENLCSGPRNGDAPVQQKPAPSINGEPARETSLSGKRIVILISRFLKLGGAERAAIMLGGALKRFYGCQVEVWGRPKAGRCSELCDAEGLLWRLVDMDWPGNALKKVYVLLRFARLLRKAKPHAVLSFVALPNLYGALTWRLAGAETFVWGQQDEGRGLATGTLIERLALKLTPCFVSNARHASEFLADRLHVPGDRLEVVPNAILQPRPRLPRHAWRKMNGFRDDQILAVKMANLTSKKDHATLLKAWRHVLDRLGPATPEPVLLLAGYDGDTADAVREQVRGLQMEGSVKFLGFVKDVESLLGAMDLAVFSSKLEGCPNAVQEAMAATLPVVATDVPAIREALAAGEYPFLAPPDDEEMFAEHVVRLIANRELRKSVGERNLEAVRTHFSPEASWARMAEIISLGTKKHG